MREHVFTLGPDGRAIYWHDETSSKKPVGFEGVEVTPAFQSWLSKTYQAFRLAVEETFPALRTTHVQATFTYLPDYIVEVENLEGEDGFFCLTYSPFLPPPFNCLFEVEQGYYLANFGDPDYCFPAPYLEEM